MLLFSWDCLFCNYWAVCFAFSYLPMFYYSFTMIFSQLPKQSVSAHAHAHARVNLLCMSSKHLFLAPGVMAIFCHMCTNTLECWIISGFTILITTVANITCRYKARSTRLMASCICRSSTRPRISNCYRTLSQSLSFLLLDTSKTIVHQSIGLFITMNEKRLFMLILWNFRAILWC